jgi:hypothetical protein
MRQLSPDLSTDALFAAAQAQSAARQDGKPAFALSARYSFKNWLDSQGKRRDFACRLIGISPREMVLIVPVTGRPGFAVAMECEEFGRWQGVVNRATSHGFAMQIIATDEERARLADKIAWYEKVQKQETVDNRKHKRIVPNNPLSMLLMGDGSSLGCFIIDMSVSGAAVSAEVIPNIGTPLAVGSIVSRVVRHRADGFAVKFVEAQDIRSLERMIHEPPH